MAHYATITSAVTLPFRHILRYHYVNLEGHAAIRSHGNSTGRIGRRAQPRWADLCTVHPLLLPNRGRTEFGSKHGQMAGTDFTSSRGSPLTCSHHARLVAANIAVSLAYPNRSGSCASTAPPMKPVNTGLSQPTALPRGPAGPEAGQSVNPHVPPVRFVPKSVMRPDIASNSLALVVRRLHGQRHRHPQISFSIHSHQSAGKISPAG
jgi:hypothetical protein